MQLLMTILTVLWAFSLVMWVYSLSQWIRFGPYRKRWNQTQIHKWSYYVLGGALFMLLLTSIMNLIK